MKRFLKHLLVVFLILAFASPALAVERRRRGDDQINDPCSNLPISQNGLIFRSEPNCPRGRGSAQILPDMSGYGRNLEQTVLANQAPLTGSGRRQGRWYEADNFMPQQNLQNVTLSGVTISAVAGTAFINANTSLINLSNYVGKELVLCDSSGFTTNDQMKGILAAAGTAETLWSELGPDNCATSLVTEANATAGWTNSAVTPFLTFESSAVDKQAGSWSLHLVANVDAARCYTTFATAAGALYKVSLWTRLSAGTSFGIRIGTAEDDITLSNIGTILASTWTNRVIYFTATSATTYLTIRETGALNNCDIYVDSVTCKQVTTPDSTGVWINSPSAANTWAMDGSAQGINWNDSNLGYTLKIRDPAFSITGPFTWEGMVYIPDGVPAAIRTIMSKSDTGLNFRSYTISLDATGKLNFIQSLLGTNAPGVITTSAAFTDNWAGWVHLACVYRGAANAGIWLNGTQLAVQNQADGAPPASVYDGPAPFMLGARYSSGAVSLQWEGSIGGNSFWKRALTGAEVVTIYNWRR